MKKAKFSMKPIVEQLVNYRVANYKTGHSGGKFLNWKKLMVAEIQEDNFQVRKLFSFVVWNFDSFHCFKKVNLSPNYFRIKLF